MTEETACPSVGESGIHRLCSGVGCGSRSAIYRQHGADRHTAHRCHDAGYNRGRTSAKTPRGHEPTLPVILISGYSVDKLSQISSIPGGVSLLEKPFTFEALVKEVRAALGISSPPSSTGIYLALQRWYVVFLLGYIFQRATQ